MDGVNLTAVLIAGPTASGKSALATAIAERTGGLVVNADSMQVYRELEILTARPGPEDLARAPHRLYGHRPAAEACSVAAWLADLAAVLREAEAAVRPVVIVGGTGLYLDAATQGLSDIPAVPADVRARVRAAAEGRAAGDLHADLAARDPEAARRIGPSDPQRIVRALEVLEATGRPMSAFLGRRAAPLLPPRRVRAALVLAPRRDDLHARIARRLDAMVEAGGIEEARRLDAMGLDPSLPAMKAIGVPQMLAAARGELTPERATAEAVVATRRYARRQETWFRNRMADWARVEPGNILATAEAVAQQVKNGG